MSIMQDHAVGALPHEEHAHPGPRTYIRIAIILAVLTAIEVELSYLPKQIDIAKWTIIPPLIIVAIVKFFMVAAWFMHLRFDSKAFTIAFVGGLALALTVFIAVLSIERVFFA